MSGLVRKLERRHDQIQAKEIMQGQCWKSLVAFCQLHERHGEMEFQSDLFAYPLFCYWLSAELRFQLGDLKRYVARQRRFGLVL